MKRRMIWETICIWGNRTSIMDGKSTWNNELDKKINLCAEECYDLFFKGSIVDFEIVDAWYNPPTLKLWIEPTYQWDYLKIICIQETKELSYIENWRAWWLWWTGVASSVRYYQDIKRKSKFTKFIDKWHPVIFPNP